LVPLGLGAAKLIETQTAIMSKYLPQYTFRWKDKSWCSGDFEGWCQSASGRRYLLWLHLPPNSPLVIPRLFVKSPEVLPMHDGRPLHTIGTSHDFHVLGGNSMGITELCHHQRDQWDCTCCYAVAMCKAAIWVEGYEEHLATGVPIAEFFRQGTRLR